MSDDVDMANDEMLKRVEETLSSLKNVDPPKNTTGKCLWCESKLEQKDQRRWCSSACRDEHVYYANKI